MAECVIYLKIFGKLSYLRRHIRRVHEETIETPSASLKSEASENKLQAESEAPSSMSSKTLLNQIEEMNVERHPTEPVSVARSEGTATGDNVNR